jgi:hypothetical protein
VLVSIAGCGPPAGISGGDADSTGGTSSSSTTGSDVDTSSSSTTGPLLCDGPQGARAVVRFAVCLGEACTDFDDTPWPSLDVEGLQRVTLTCTVDEVSQVDADMRTRLDECTGDAMPSALVVDVPISVGESHALTVGDRVEVQHEQTRDDLDRVVEAWRLRDAQGRLLAVSAKGDGLPGLVFTAPLVFVPGPPLCLIEEGYCGGLVSQGAVIALLDGVEVTLGNDRETVIAADGTGWTLANDSEYHLDHLCGAWGTYWRHSISAIAAP